MVYTALKHRSKMNCTDWTRRRVTRKSGRTSFIDTRRLSLTWRPKKTTSWKNATCQIGRAKTLKWLVDWWWLCMHFILPFLSISHPFLFLFASKKSTCFCLFITLYCIPILSSRIKGGAVANRLRRRTSDQTVLGSNPAVAAALNPWTRLFTPIVPRRSLHISFS